MSESISGLVIEAAPGALMRLMEVAADTAVLRLLAHKLGNESLSTLDAVIGWHAIIGGPAITFIYMAAMYMAKYRENSPKEFGAVFRFYLWMTIPLWFYSIILAVSSKAVLKSASSFDQEAIDDVYGYNLIYGDFAAPFVVMASLLQRTYTAANIAWQGALATFLHRGFIVFVCYLALYQDLPGFPKNPYHKAAASYAWASAIAVGVWFGFVYYSKSLAKHGIFSARLLTLETKQSLFLSGLCSMGYSVSEIGKFTFATVQASNSSVDQAAAMGLLVQWLMISDGMAYGIGQVFGQRVSENYSGNFARAMKFARISLAVAFIIGTAFVIAAEADTKGMVTLIAERDGSDRVELSVQVLRKGVWSSIPCALRNSVIGFLYAANAHMGGGNGIAVLAASINLFANLVFNLPWALVHPDANNVAQALATAVTVVFVLSSALWLYLKGRSEFPESWRRMFPALFPEHSAVGGAAMQSMLPAGHMGTGSL